MLFSLLLESLFILILHDNYDYHNTIQPSILQLDLIVNINFIVTPQYSIYIIILIKLPLMMTMQAMSLLGLCWNNYIIMKK